MLFKKCPHCGMIIPQTLSVCEKCASAAKSRHMEYNLTRRDHRAAEFYVSKEWRMTRRIILNVFDNIDLYAFYINNEIAKAERVHHIIELDEDWQKRLEPANLFPLSIKNHGIISAIYKKSEQEKKQMQRTLMALVERHFAERGGFLNVWNYYS